MSNDDLWKRLEDNEASDDPRCERCGSLLSVVVTEVSSVITLEQSCSNIECSLYKKVVRKARV